MEDESGYHVVVRCSMAVALRNAMQEHWSLPGERQFKYTGPDWLLLLLNSVGSETRAKVLLLLWRVWHIRNDITHGNGTASVVGSVEFLKHYAVSLGFGEQGTPERVFEKGKEKVVEGAPAMDKERPLHVFRKGWVPLPPGWAKMNTDASFSEQTGEASSGVVIQDAEGSILLSAWKTLENMASVEEAEACLEGSRLAVEWIKLPILIESDCAELVKALGTGGGRWSRWVGTISEIKAVSRLLQECNYVHVRRDSNQVAHELAKLGARGVQGRVMHFSVPSEVQSLVQKEAVQGSTDVTSCAYFPM
jgi:hypothetical protein